MELTEPIESINNQLVDLFGIDTLSGQPIWRIVWSNDQYEYRMSDCTPEGIQLIRPKVQWLPKYKQWIPNKFVLERLVVVPEVSKNELPASNVRYEPIFVFENSKHEHLPPKLTVAKFAIDAVYATQGKSSLGKYKDPDYGLNTADLIEKKRAELAQLEEDLYGNETPAGDALAYGHGVVVPHNFKEEN